MPTPINTNTYTIRPCIVGAGAVTGVLNMLLLANQAATLVDYFKKQSPTLVLTAPTESKKSEEPVPEQHFITDHWVSSFEHETAVFLDIGKAGLTSAEAMVGLRKLYPRKEDTPGVRMLSNGSKMLIVFADTQLQQHALLYGFQMNDRTVLYGTKALDGQYNHTLFVIEGLPIEDPVTTRTKLESSLAAIFRKTPNLGPDQHRVDGNPWPPTMHDVFFHQSNGGYYDGKVTVILRGSVSFLQRSIQLESFYKQTFNCRTHQISFYCHHCMRVDRHRAQHCPRVRHEAS